VIRKIILLCILALTLAACGGGDPPRDYEERLTIVAVTHEYNESRPQATATAQALNNMATLERLSVKATEAALRYKQELEHDNDIMPAGNEGAFAAVAKAGAARDIFAAQMQMICMAGGGIVGILILVVIGLNLPTWMMELTQATGTRVANGLAANHRDYAIPEPARVHAPPQSPPIDVPDRENMWPVAIDLFVEAGQRLRRWSKSRMIGTIDGFSFDMWKAIKDEGVRVGALHEINGNGEVAPVDNYDAWKRRASSIRFSPAPPPDPRILLRFLSRYETG
jgi:hypothetical protein